MTMRSRRSLWGTRPAGDKRKPFKPTASSSGSTIQKPFSTKSLISVRRNEGSLLHELCDPYAIAAASCSGVRVGPSILTGGSLFLHLNQQWGCLVWQHTHCGMDVRFPHTNSIKLVSPTFLRRRAECTADSESQSAFPFFTATGGGAKSEWVGN